jgi:hypothetical protein
MSLGGISGVVNLGFSLALARQESARAVIGGSAPALREWNA